MQPLAGLVILACSQAVPEPAALAAALQQHGLQNRIVPEPCSSKVEAYQLLRILADGADLVWVIGCPEDRCLLAEGSTRLAFRVRHAQEYLQELGLEPARLGYSRLATEDQAGLAEVLAQIQQLWQQLGPNPCRPRQA
jgi:F420-non-reducing hydrogenase iron-sulfur subunit